MATTIIRENGERMTLDAEPSFSASPENLVTEHPLEDGTLVTDHIEKLPEHVTISGPVSSQALHSGKSFATDPNRPLRARDFFRSISGEVVTLVSTLFGTYPSMALVRYPYDVRTLKGVRFTATFKEIVLAKSESVPLSALEPTQDIGNQPTTTPADPPEAESASVLFGLGQSIGIF